MSDARLIAIALFVGAYVVAHRNNESVAFGIVVGFLCAWIPTSIAYMYR